MSQYFYLLLLQTWPQIEEREPQERTSVGSGWR